MQVETKITFDWDDLKNLVIQELQNTMGMQVNVNQLEIKEDENGEPYIIVKMVQ